MPGVFNFTLFYIEAGELYRVEQVTEVILPYDKSAAT